MFDLVVVGGGFYGCMLAIHEAKKGRSVCILEKNSDILMEASLNNQAIVHRGYHYPRSIATINNSNGHYDRFISDFKSAIYNKHKKYHAIAETASFVDEKQYQKLYNKLNIPIKKVKFPGTKGIKAVFETPETSFNADLLRKEVRRRLMSSPLIEVRLGVSCDKITDTKKGLSNVYYTKGLDELLGGKSHVCVTKRVALCTYAGTNRILNWSKFPRIDLKYQLAEMVLVDVPKKWKNVGFTLMDGPFFSLTPFPSQNCHVISHVQHSVHAQWRDDGMFFIHSNANKPNSNFKYIEESVKRYLPKLKLKYKGSIFEVKTLLPISCHDDGRPVLLTPITKNITSIIGSKIDNVYDMLEQWENQ